MVFRKIHIKIDRQICRPKNEEIIYIVNEYKNHSGANVTRGGFEYGRNGFTWLAMGSYINELKKYVDPSSNHPLPNHDTDHLYKIRKP